MRRDARDAGRVLRRIRTSARCWSWRWAASRSSRSVSPNAARRHGKPRRDHGDPERGWNRSRHGQGGRPSRRRWRRQLAAQEREWCDVSELVLSLKCGGSDYTSGLASNPTLGRVADRLIDLGGSAVLGEIAEIMGAEHLLASRATRPATSAKLIQVITRVEMEARALGSRHPRHTAVAWATFAAASRRSKRSRSARRTKAASGRRSRTSSGMRRRSRARA